MVRLLVEMVSDGAFVGGAGVSYKSVISQLIENGSKLW